MLGDIHGNIDDLRFFSQRLWTLGMHLTGSNFLFMGDYVDRGMYGIEGREKNCSAYLSTIIFISIWNADFFLFFSWSFFLFFFLFIVVMYLFAYKIKVPEKVFLLRGNHETRSVNGWIDWYKHRCFLDQCRQRFGRYGDMIWEKVNQVFGK